MVTIGRNHAQLSPGGVGGTGVLACCSAEDDETAALDELVDAAAGMGGCFAVLVRAMAERACAEAPLALDESTGCGDRVAV